MERQFANFSEVQTYVKENYSGFGHLTTSQWQEIAKHSVKPELTGGYILHYDPQIAYLLRSHGKNLIYYYHQLLQKCSLSNWI